MRDELLNVTLFFSLDHARTKIAGWAEDYTSSVRIRCWAISLRRPTPPKTLPQRSIGYATPPAPPIARCLARAKWRNIRQDSNRHG